MFILKFNNITNKITDKNITVGSGGTLHNIILPDNHNDALIFMKQSNTEIITLTNLLCIKKDNNLWFQRKVLESPGSFYAKKGNVFQEELIIDDVDDKLIKMYEVSLVSGNLHFTEVQDNQTIFLNDFYEKYNEIHEKIKRQKDIEIQSLDELSQSLEQQNLDENLVCHAAVTSLLETVQNIEQASLDESLLFHTAITMLTEEMYSIANEKDGEIESLKAILTNNVINETDKRVAALNVSLASKDKEIASLKATVTNKDIEITSLQTTLNNIKNTVTLLTPILGFFLEKNDLALLREMIQLMNILKISLENALPTNLYPYAYGETALSYAVRLNNIEAVKILRDAGAIRGRSIIIAAFHNYENILKELLNGYGKIPLALDQEVFSVANGANGFKKVLPNILIILIQHRASNP